MWVLLSREVLAALFPSSWHAAAHQMGPVRTACTVSTFPDHCTTYTAAIHNLTAVQSGDEPVRRRLKQSSDVRSFRNRNAQRRHRRLLLWLFLPFLSAHCSPESVQTPRSLRR
jgi:hypothetical protein